MDKEASYRPSSETWAAYFAQELSPKDRQQVEAWVSTSTAHRDEMEAMRQVWLDMGVLRAPDVRLDLDHAFDRVKQKKEQLEVKRAISPWVWRVAASLVLVSSVVLWFWLQSPDPLRQVASAVEEVQLSDGSLVTLNEQAILTYPEKFVGEERTVALTGEAFFEVAHDPEQPFRVQAGPVTITVLGTSFQVNFSPDQVTVMVASGKVKVQSDFADQVLVAGDQVVLDLMDERSTSGSVSASGTELFWLSGKLTFEGVVLSEVIRDLESVFGVRIGVSRPEILNCRLQASFEGQALPEILEIIALSQHLTVSEVNDGYTLAGEGCEN